MHGRPCRSPLGERGLKSNNKLNNAELEKSLSAWRAWIEILNTMYMADLK